MSWSYAKFNIIMKIIMVKALSRSFRGKCLETDNYWLKQHCLKVLSLTLFEFLNNAYFSEISARITIATPMTSANVFHLRLSLSFKPQQALKTGTWRQLERG